MKHYGIVRREYHEQVPHLEFIPDGAVMQNYPNGTGKGDPIGVTENVRQHLRRINNDRGYWYAYETRGAYWINNNNLPVRAESIYGGGNFFESMAYVNGHYLLKSYPTNLPIPLSHNWFNHPETHQKVSAVNRDLKVINPNGGIDCMIPLIRNTNNPLKIGVWLHWKMAEMFPVIPNSGLILTNSNTGNKVNITEYKLQGASVLGKTVSGWKYLLKSTKPGERIFPFLEWRLSTEGVIPPI
jgi:hypothetical protein